MELQRVTAVSHVLPERVTNINELFQALAIGWESGNKNFLIASNWGGQFIRVFDESNRHPRPYWNKQENDIPVEPIGYNYRMAGFIKFESKIFKDMFETYQDDEHIYCTAKLTRKGFEFAQLNLVDFDYANSTLSHVPFFNPAIKEIKQDLRLGETKLIGRHSGENQG